MKTILNLSFNFLKNEKTAEFIIIPIKDIINSNTDTIIELQQLH